ncbi:hypothetical protein [Deinococcus sp.]|uniref:hypothetical protein n=1 Tax=Deinococcus sp. TaxID=47478 RepID=UPI003C7D38FB
MLGVVLHGYTLALVWTALTHDGNSSTDVRLELAPHREVFSGLARPDFQGLATTDAGPSSGRSTTVSSGRWTPPRTPVSW